jgi:hypothetical protein
MDQQDKLAAAREKVEQTEQLYYKIDIFTLNLF